MMSFVPYLAPGALLALLLPVGLVSGRAEAAACTADVYAGIRAPAAAGTAPVALGCDLSLAKNDVITAPIVFSGSRASGVTLDCNGGTLDGTAAKRDVLLIQSVERPDGSWDVPRGTHIRNCTIRGGIRIRGLGANGEAENVRRSSLEAGHTQRAQAAAPSGITLSNITLEANGRIPLYAAPGVTGMTIENSRITGTSASTAIYLDAESAGNRIIGNTFTISTAKREMIAVDGSADNRIENNVFDNPVTGGIFLYRNCGEGGTIRHQAPERNLITGNTFRYRNFWGARPAVWLGSRQGARSYCFSSPGHPFGSSLSPLDFARHNTVTGNHLAGGAPELILDHDRENIVSGND
ncbi:hypothetical protein PMI07_003815 [Rhizobium sp. CF080]|nr:hypothetical protein PMI07_003815 [Rhizobium sp. CF080]